MTRWKRQSITIGLLGFAFVLAACTGTTSSSAEVQGATMEASSEPAASGSAAAASDGGASASGQAGAEARACDALQAWSDEMRALADLDPATASVEDVRTQVDIIRAAWGAVRTSMQEVEVTDEQAVADAGEQLETGLDEFQTDVPVAQAVADVQTAAQPLKAVYTEMADGLGCTIENPY